ncbi:MAG TPA: prenyltransferase/squalene oxidase repeat-containing protein [Myxococcota bacterium]|jgi:squalene/oxidosqualene cyclase-like protein|nr:prenyltransferase/squalene oxidase repeat-containing protein [Myxococcota bacterium]
MSPEITAPWSTATAAAAGGAAAGAGVRTHERLADPVGAALAHLGATQDPATGGWKGDYGGPMFLLPIFVATARTVGFALDGDTRAGMERYFRAHQNGDGGWGLHVEGHSHVFTTLLSYVALRFLGAAAADAALERARAFLRAHGGPRASAAWGKFALAVFGLYDWEGLHPVPPELWLLPEALPIHPSRLWCHCRMVYLPMSYLYGRRATVAADPLTAAVREELWDGERWEAIDWRAARDACSPTDRYVPHSPLMRAVNRALGVYERVHPAALRARALAHVLDHVRAEDRATDYICIGPVNKLFNTLAWHFAAPGGPELRRHLERLPDYLWRAADGVKMQGYNSSELWDTAFAAQAALATGRVGAAAAGAAGPAGPAGPAGGAGSLLAGAHRFIESNQVLENVSEHERWYRHRSRGGWPFSTRAHGWPISDCTAEGLKASLLLEPLVADPISAPRLADAADVILSMQNDDGGWATYERTRGPRWLELLNPSDCFADIMIDYSYVECTSACVQALAAFRTRFPGVRGAEVQRAVARGRDFMLASQRADGSWEGSWGVCFTYGTWFGVWGLRAAGLPASHPALARAADFLVAHQRPDGGWGETAESCRARAYVQAADGQAVMTAWAVLALLRAGRARSEAVRRGVAFLEARQRPDGTWPAEHIAGMFNKTCAIHYDNYLKIFPLWALARADRAEDEA